MPSKGEPDLRPACEEKALLPGRPGQSFHNRGSAELPGQVESWGVSAQITGCNCGVLRLPWEKGPRKAQESQAERYSS